MGTSKTCCGPFILGVAVLVPAAAAQNFADNFDDGDDNGWTHFEPLVPFGAGGTYTFPGGGYRMQAPPSPSPAAVGPNRIGSIAPAAANSSNDFFMSAELVDFGVSPSTGTMVAALGFHGRDVGLGTTDGYLLNVFINPNTNEMMLNFNVVTDEFGTAIGASTILGALTAIRLTVEGHGSDFTGRAFDLGTDALLGEITASDSTWSPSGFTGLFVAGAQQPIDNPPLDATFDNFLVVPAPGSLALLSLACLGATRRRRA